MTAARFIAALGELADVARALFAPAPRPPLPAPPLAIAQGSSPAIDVPEVLPPGLVPCSDCGTEQRPGAVHYPTLLDQRPCRGSWSGL